MFPCVVASYVWLCSFVLPSPQSHAGNAAFLGKQQFTHYAVLAKTQSHLSTNASRVLGKPLITTELSGAKFFKDQLAFIPMFSASCQ